MNADERFERAIAEIESATDDLNRAMASIDHLVKDGVESGIETGQILGLLEAYNYLVRSGHKKAAADLKKHIDASHTARGS